MRSHWISSFPLLTRNTFHFKFHKTNDDGDERRRTSAWHWRKIEIRSHHLFTACFAHFVSLYITRFILLSIPLADEIWTHNWSERGERGEETMRWIYINKLSSQRSSIQSPMKKDRSVLSHQGATTWDEWVTRDSIEVDARRENGDPIDMIDDFFLSLSLSFSLFSFFRPCLSLGIGIMFV